MVFKQSQTRVSVKKKGKVKVNSSAKKNAGQMPPVRMPLKPVEDVMHKRASLASQGVSLPSRPAPACKKRTTSTSVRKAGTVPRKSAKSGKQIKRKLRWSYMVVLVAVVLVVGGGGFFSWDRWMRFDDQSSFAGTWTVDGSAQTITIDPSAIALSSNVSYSYTLDTFAKTISFSLGSMQGLGHYRFVDNRTKLIIWEQGDTSWLSTLIFDIAWTWDGFVGSFEGTPQSIPDPSDTISVYYRAS